MEKEEFLANRVKEGHAPWTALQAWKFWLTSTNLLEAIKRAAAAYARSLGCMYEKEEQKCFQCGVMTETRVVWDDGTWGKKVSCASCCSHILKTKKKFSHVLLPNKWLYCGGYKKAVPAAPIVHCWCEQSGGDPLMARGVASACGLPPAMLTPNMHEKVRACNQLDTKKKKREEEEEEEVATKKKKVEEEFEWYVNLCSEDSYEGLCGFKAAKVDRDSVFKKVEPDQLAALERSQESGEPYSMTARGAPYLVDARARMQVNKLTGYQRELLRVPKGSSFEAGLDDRVYPLRSKLEWGGDEREAYSTKKVVAFLYELSETHLREEKEKERRLAKEKEEREAASKKKLALPDDSPKWQYPLRQIRDGFVMKSGHYYDLRKMTMLPKEGRAAFALALDSASQQTVAYCVHKDGGEWDIGKTGKYGVGVTWKLNMQSGTIHKLGGHGEDERNHQRLPEFPRVNPCFADLLTTRKCKGARLVQELMKRSCGRFIQDMQDGKMAGQFDQSNHICRCSECQANQRADNVNNVTRVFLARRLPVQVDPFAEKPVPEQYDEQIRKIFGPEYVSNLHGLDHEAAASIMSHTGFIGKGAFDRKEDGKTRVGGVEGPGTKDGHIKDYRNLLVKRGPPCKVTGLPVYDLVGRDSDRSPCLTGSEKSRYPGCMVFEPEKMIFGSPALKCCVETHYAKPSKASISGVDTVQFVLHIRMKVGTTFVQEGTTWVSSVDSSNCDPLFTNHAIEYFSFMNTPPYCYVTGVEIVFNH